MRVRMRGLLAVTVAALALAGSTGLAHAAKPGKGLGKPVARGKVSDLDTAKKTFVVTNKKAGAVTVSFSDTTKFKLVSPEPDTKPTDGSVKDLQNGVRAVVRGTANGSAVTAVEVTIGHKKKAKKPATT